MISTSVFTGNELDYLQKQRLGRLATVGVDGNPHVVPVGSRYNLEADAELLQNGGEQFDFTFARVCKLRQENNP